MKLSPTIARMLDGARSGDAITLLIVLFILALVLLVVTVIVNARAARRNRNAPPPDWGSNSSRYRK